MYRFFRRCICLVFAVAALSSLTILRASSVPANAMVALIYPNETYQFSQEGNTYSILDMSRQYVTDGEIFISLPQGVTKGLITVRLVNSEGYIELYRHDSPCGLTFSSATSIEEAGAIEFDDSYISQDESTLASGLMFRVCNGRVTIKDIVITEIKDEPQLGVFENVKSGETITAPSVDGYSFIGWTNDGESFIENYSKPTITVQNDGTYKAVYAKLEVCDDVQLNTKDLSENNLGLCYSFRLKLINMAINQGTEAEQNTVLNELINDESYITIYAKRPSGTFKCRKTLNFVSVEAPDDIMINVLLGEMSVDDDWYVADIYVELELYVNNLKMTASTLNHFGKAYSIKEVAQSAYENSTIDEQTAKIYGITA